MTKPDQEHPERSVRAGRVELIQRQDGELVIRFHRKAGLVVETAANVDQLERWAIRQLREGVFA